MNSKSMEKVLLKGWEETRKLTYDFIDGVNLEVLNEKLPRPGLDTFAKQIYEMALVQKAYTKVLHGYPLDFSKVEGITFGKENYVAKSNEDLVNLLKDADKFFYDTVSDVSDWHSEVDIFGEKFPKYAVLELLTRHETLHHGQFVAFGYLLRIKMPESWITAWALPTNEGK